MASHKEKLALGAIIAAGIAGYIYTREGRCDFRIYPNIFEFCTEEF